MHAEVKVCQGCESVAYVNSLFPETSAAAVCVRVCVCVCVCVSCTVHEEEYISLWHHAASVQSAEMVLRQI